MARTSRWYQVRFHYRRHPFVNRVDADDRAGNGSRRECFSTAAKYFYRLRRRGGLSRSYRGPRKNQKAATQGDELTIKMVKNPDIVAGVAALKDHRPYVVGFAAETNNVEEYARQKRIRKNLDLICANDVSQPTQGFNSDNNALHLFWQDGDKVLPLERKELLGQLLLDEIVTRYDEKNRR